VTSGCAQARLGSYDGLAAEYYDAARHPTCANFRQGSEQLLERLIPDVAPERSCEIGAGDSLLAALLVRRGHDVRGVLLTDASAAMLEHSRRWERLGATLNVAEAHQLPVAAGSLDLLVASLGDPYDDESFWSEVARVLARRGRCVLTTPSWTWATRFRSDGVRPDEAEFELRDGARLTVRSLIRTVEEQRVLIERQRLLVLEQHAVPAAAIEEPVSPKLRVLAPDEPVVVGYVVAAEA
jgi:SAM-dependent methyltransferase